MGAASTFMRSSYSGAGRNSFTGATTTQDIDLPAIISIEKLSKVYASGFQALKSVDLDIQRG